MLFNSTQFVLFIAIVLAIHRALPYQARNSWLLAASLVFYSLWIPEYLILLLVDVGVNYALVRMIAHSPRPKLPTGAAVVFTLVVLAYFKYAAFLIGSVGALVGMDLASVSGAGEILLPLGISFYSFQMIAFAVDVYRGEIEVPRSFSRYLLFVLFFPQLIAGPILRGREFLSQLKYGGQVTAERTRRGFWLIAAGVVKKVILGDFLLAGFVTQVFAHPQAMGAPDLLVGMYGFLFLIYFDFSGYSDIARGLANFFGFELPLNFTEPYLSRSVPEFWRRWHITLSNWLRDYIYIPLGGNRRGSVRVYRNLFITMVLGGLWHGAGWNYVAWGAAHGVLLGIHRIFGDRAEEGPLTMTTGNALRIAVTFNLCALAQVFFRSHSIGDAAVYFTNLFTTSYFVHWPVLPTLLIVLCMILHIAERYIRLRLPQIRAWLDSFPGGVVLEAAGFGVVAALAVIANGSGAEFFYFQF